MEGAVHFNFYYLCNSRVSLSLVHLRLNMQLLQNPSFFTLWHGLWIHNITCTCNYISTCPPILLSPFQLLYAHMQDVMWAVVIYLITLACVFVCVREREREGGKERERERERGGERERERERGRERECVCVCVCVCVCDQICRDLVMCTHTHCIHIHII